MPTYVFSCKRSSQLNLSDTANRANVSFYVERKHLKYLWTLSTISAYNKLIHTLFTYVESGEWRGNKSVQIGTPRITATVRKMQRVKRYLFTARYKKSRAQRITAILSHVLTYVPRYRPGATLFPNYDADNDNEEQGEEGRRERNACEPCTYVSVNDEDYRSFLAAGEKLKASSLRAPFSPFRVQWQQKTFGAHERTVATWIHYSL